MLRGNSSTVLASTVEYMFGLFRVVDTLDFVVKNLDNTDVIVNACVELGEAHKMHRIKPEYFDVS